MDTLGMVLDRARETGYRALLVLNGDRASLVEEAAGINGGDCVLVGDATVRRGHCRLELSPARYTEVLGSEYGAAIVSLESMVRPSIVAAVGEAVKGGGFLAIVGGPWDSWTPGPREGGTGLYKRYLERAIPRSRLHAWIDSGVVRSSQASVRAPDPRRDAAQYKPRGDLPRRLIGEAATLDQARALDKITSFLRSRSRSLLLRGDRGRGKSYVVGLALAYSIWRRHSGRVVVLGPTPRSVASLMRGLLRGLQVLGIKPRVVMGGGEVVRVSGPWFRVSYESPDTAEPAPLLVVDEAASVGVARVRRLSWASGKTIVSTTVHGYEGSGRVFARLIEGQLPRPVETVGIEEPIRYPSGDPLEEWIYETFLLKAEPPEPEDTGTGDVEYRIVDRSSLSEPGGAIRWIMGILVQAHYRNTPDNLLLLLEGDHTVHALYRGEVPVAVADTLLEGEDADRDARLAWEKLRIYALPRQANGLRTLRVSRIAVAPSLQGRGLGSMLLARVEEHAEREGVDAVTTIFSRHDVIRFWLKNGYHVVYISPRYNKVTGEKNIAMAKPLTSKGWEIVAAASCNMKERLLEAAQSIYRDLAAEKILEMLSHWIPCSYTPCISSSQEARARMYLEGEIDLEQAMDAVVKILRAEAMAGRIRGDRHLIVVARIIQGKPWDEAARIAGMSIEEAQRALDRLVREILPPALSQYRPCYDPANIEA